MATERALELIIISVKQWQKVTFRSWPKLE